MITKIEGKFTECSENSVTLDVRGFHYEIFVPLSILKNMGEKVSGDSVSFVIYHYVQSDPSRSIPTLIGFTNKVEREFFEKFITVSGVGPKAALKALSVPISQIANAIDSGDQAFLKTLPGVGDQRAREIIAKLQGKVGRFGLIQDEGAGVTHSLKTDFKVEALEVLSQLQYRKDEAQHMIQRALEANKNIKSVEDLLNEVYQQKSAQTVAG